MIDELLTQSALVVGVVWTCMLGPGLAIGFLLLRKRHRKVMSYAARATAFGCESMRWRTT